MFLQFTPLFNYYLISRKISPYIYLLLNLKGFDALNYEEHTDYELVQSTNPEFNKV